MVAQAQEAHLGWSAMRGAVPSTASSRELPVGAAMALSVGILAILLEGVVAGESRALREIYDESSATLLGVVLRIVREQCESEDVLQEIYVTVWRRAGDFDPDRGDAMTWLCSIARNRAIDRVRSRGRRPRTCALDEVVLIDAALSPAAHLERSDLYRQLNSHMLTLRVEHRDAIRGAFLDGLTHEALAERAGVPVGTMKSWVRRGLLQLRHRLGTN